MAIMIAMVYMSTNIAGYPRRPLAEVAEIFTGLASARRAAHAEDESTTVALVNVRDLDDGRVASLEQLETRPVPRDYSADRYRIREGDVLVTCRGTQLKVARVTGNAHGAVMSSNLIGIRTGPDLLSPVLFAFLRSRRGEAALLARSRSSTLSLALSPKSVGQIEVPVPPIEVQQQIAELVSAAEENYVAALGAAEQRRTVAHEVANNLLTGEPAARS